MQIKENIYRSALICIYCKTQLFVMTDMGYLDAECSSGEGFYSVSRAEDEGITDSKAFPLWSFILFSQMCKWVEKKSVCTLLEVKTTLNSSKLLSVSLLNKFADSRHLPWRPVGSYDEVMLKTSFPQRGQGSGVSSRENTKGPNVGHLFHLPLQMQS